MRLRNKNGDISATTLVGVILLLLGFGVVLMMLMRIYYSSNPEREICRESVVLRGTFTSATGGWTGDFVNLRCKTQKYCITSGLIGSKCEANFGTEDKVTKLKVDSSRKISKAVADQVLDCWDMMGQGRVSLFSPGWMDRFGISPGGGVYSSCVICSRLALDLDSLRSKKINISDANVYDYMLRYKVPGQDFSYAEYIAQGSPAGASIRNFQEIGKEKTDEFSKELTSEISKLEEVQPQTTPVEDLQKAELAVVFMQISVPTASDVLKNTLFAGLAFTLGATKIAGVGGVYKATSLIFSNPYTAGLAVLGGVAFAGYQAWNVYSNYNTAVGYCGDLVFAADENREDTSGYGCSAVRVIPYDLDSIRNVCGVVESIA